MKKNILIIGFGDLAERFERLVPNNSHTILGLTRSPNNHKGKNLTEWDWDKGQEFQLPIKHFDTVIFFPRISDTHVGPHLSTRNPSNITLSLLLIILINIILF